MKRCSYCGAQYPDEMTECPVDHEAIVSFAVSPQPVNREKPKRTVSVACSTVSSMIVWLLAALYAVGMGVFSGITARGCLTTGWTYSFGIVFNDTSKIYRSSSPTMYWTMIAIWSSTCVAGIFVGVMVAIQTIKQYKKSRALKTGGEAVREQHPSA
jgi:hypothetical protein